MHRTDYLIGKHCYGRVLEIGCGDGRRSFVMDMMGSDVVGIDDALDIATARERAKGYCLNNCSFACYDDERHGAGQFGTIVISTIKDGKESYILKRVCESLTPDGQVILAIPHSTHTLGGMHLSRSKIKNMKERLLGLFPVAEAIQDEFTQWRLFVFRHSPKPSEGLTSFNSPPKQVNSTSLPKVSVIITTYNRAQMLPRAIDSIFNQTYPNIEIIVVNDGSTDETSEILEDYESQITVIHKTQNAGISAASNTGIQASTGEFVHRFDDDDVMFPRKIECQVRKVQQNPQLGLVYTAAYMKWHRPEKRQKKFGCMGRELSLWQYALHPSTLILTSATLIKKSCLEQVGFFDEALQAAEECDRFMRIMAHYDHYFIPVPGVIYSKHGGNFTFTQKEVIKKSVQQIQRKMIDQMSIEELLSDIAHIEDEEEKRKQYSIVLMQRGRVSAIKGCHDLACQDFECALSYAPENRAAKKYLKEAQEALKEISESNKGT